MESLPGGGRDPKLSSPSRQSRTWREEGPGLQVASALTGGPVWDPARLRGSR